MYAADKTSLLSPQGADPSIGERFITSHYKGTRPMTRPMRGFNEYYPREKFGGATGPTKTEKIAVMLPKGAPKALSGMNAGSIFADAISSGVSGLKSMWGDATPMRKALAVGVPLAGATAGIAATAADPLFDMLKPYAETAGTNLSRRNQSLYSRANMDQMAAESFAKQMGSEAAKGLAGVVGGALMEVPHVVARPIQARLVKNLLDTDPILSQASLTQQQLMSDSYDSMRSVAPTVARDTFAVKNFLREVMVTGNGPDHATLGNLARTEQTLRGQ